MPTTHFRALHSSSTSQLRLHSPNRTLNEIMLLSLSSCRAISSSRCSFRLAFSEPNRKKPSLLFFVSLHCNRKISFGSHAISSSSSNGGLDPIPIQTQLDYDTSEALLGLDVDLNLGDVRSDVPKPRSWFGPNGQYVRELPCPSCRGRGYTPCTECDVERSNLDCSQCNGKGITTCHACLGECVIWEESIDEQPWEKARSISPIKVKEDDEVDNLDIKLDDKKKSKRVYQSPSPEVGLKISRTLKSLNAKTGLFSKRMKLIHQNPILRAQRVAAIKKARRSPAARKHTSETLKAFFSNPENRRKRSISMIGVKFFCSNCGREGHRRFYCPELKNSSVDGRFACRLCGEKGHNKRTCPQLKPKLINNDIPKTRRRGCRVCGENGHNRRTCPQLGRIGSKKRLLVSGSRTCTCRLCHQKGHNARTCPRRNMNPVEISPQSEGT